MNCLVFLFAFNKFLKETNIIHRLPLMLDSSFKEGLDGKSKVTILDFICINRASNTQSVISLADNKLKDFKIEFYTKKFFGNNTKLVCIGESILKDHSNDF